jgi:hypothetical protein
MFSISWTDSTVASIEHTFAIFQAPPAAPLAGGCAVDPRCRERRSGPLRAHTCVRVRMTLTGGTVLERGELLPWHRRCNGLCPGYWRCAVEQQRSTFPRSRIRGARCVRGGSTSLPRTARRAQIGYRRRVVPVDRNENGPAASNGSSPPARGANGRAYDIEIDHGSPDEST